MPNQRITNFMGDTLFDIKSFFHEHKICRKCLAPVTVEVTTTIRNNKEDVILICRSWCCDNCIEATKLAHMKPRRMNGILNFHDINTLPEIHEYLNAEKLPV